MKTTLTSINKPHIDNILAGNKDVEWRTKPLPIGKHFAYETKRHGGRGLVTGTFEVVRNYVFSNVDEIPEHYIRRGMVSREYLSRYAKGRPLYANIIISPIKYWTPRPLSHFAHICPTKNCQNCKYSKGGWSCSPVSVPPQSFMYVELWE